MLIHYKDIIKRAYAEQWAIGAFNTSNLELSQAIIEAAEELQSPVIIQTSEKAIDYAGLQQLTAIITTLAAESPVPIILNLDHGRSFEIAERCLSVGYTALMRDASKLSYEDNIKETRRVVALATKAGRPVGVEGELGSVGGEEDYIHGEISLTDPEKAKDFIDRTGVDLLAVAIGNVHGYVKELHLRMDILTKIFARTKGTPLVLHGSSGIPEDFVKEAIRNGVVKINVDSDLRHAFAQKLRTNLAENKSLYDPRGILGPAKDAVKQLVKEKIVLFGSSGKAK